jgi:coenzyme F420 biosynthesis associated uncharacterized protein
VIDWRLAGLVSQGVLAAGPSPAAGESAPFEAVDGPARESAEVVGAYTGLRAATALPAAEAVDRAAWTRTALDGMRGLLDPVAGRLGEGFGPFAGPARAVGGGLLGAEVGAVAGVLGQRVLGQYEFAILDPVAPARLLFVAPNLARAARSLDAQPDELLRWVALHEITHALQFGGVPWLRAHLAARVRELLGALEVGVDPRRLGAGDLRGLADAVRRGELATLVLGPEQRARFDAMQALMAVLEGYAEHVMDAVGRDLIPRLPQLRAGMDRRRRDRTGLLRVFEKLIGLDLKMRQYEIGKAFCDAVVERGGIGALNRVWAGPEHMPTGAELEDPAAWLANARS